MREGHRKILNMNGVGGHWFHNKINTYFLLLFRKLINIRSYNFRFRAHPLPTPPLKPRVDRPLRRFGTISLFSFRQYFKMLIEYISYLVSMPKMNVKSLPFIVKFVLMLRNTYFRNRDV